MLVNFAFPVEKPVSKKRKGRPPRQLNSRALCSDSSDAEWGKESCLHV